MKLPMTFRIDAKNNRPCTEGGLNHNLVADKDRDGFVIGHRCPSCGKMFAGKARKKRIVKKIVL